MWAVTALAVHGLGFKQSTDSKAAFGMGGGVTFDPESEPEFFCRQFPFPLKFSKDSAGKVSQVLAFERDTWKKVDDYKPSKP